MKLRHTAIAAACLAAGSSAFAANFNFYVSGSSALQKVVATSITNNCTNVVTLKGLLGSPAAGPLDTGNGNSQTLYVCTIGATAPATASWGAANLNSTINVFVNTLGSSFGVFPVALNTPVAFIDPTSCGATTCNNVAQVQPDAGLSDLEPLMFNDASNHPVDPTVGGTYYTPPGNVPAPAGTIFPLDPRFAGKIVSTAQFSSSKVVAVQTFGVIVSNQLLADLQADQGTATPSISSSAINTLYAPGYSTGNMTVANGGPGLWAPLFSHGAGHPSWQVNICSRLPGSGTRASAQAFFLQKPFSNYAQSFATAANDNTADVTNLSDGISQNTTDLYDIGEYDNSGAVTGCVAASSTAGNYAIGFVSADRASGGTNNYTFVNLDGSVPNAITAARFGDYQWVYEAYYNINKANPHGQQAFAGAFSAAFQTPANITALGAPSTNGVMAAVANCPVPAAASCSHVTRNGNARAALLYAQ